MLLQREQFLTIFYTINSSPMLVSKSVFKLIFVSSNYQTCTFPLKEHVDLDRSCWSLKTVCYKMQMIHTNVSQNCTVFLLPRRLTRSVIYGSKMFDTNKWPTLWVRKVKGKTVQFRDIFVWIIVFYFNNIHLHFITNGYISKTNSTDPRQRVPLIL